MSSNANSNRDDDKFFPPRTDDDKPKAPGAFTQQFMGAAGAPTGPVSPLDSKTPASATPFTAQFGNMNSLGSASESGTGSVPERVSRGAQPPASGGSFTTMFGSNAAAQKQAIEPQTEVTRVFERAATKSQVPQEAKPDGFTEMFGSVRPPAPESTTPSGTADLFEGKTPDFAELFKSAAPTASTPAAQVPLSPLSAQPGTGRFTELFKNELPSAAPKPAPAPTPFSNSGASGFTELFKGSPISAQPSAPPPPTPPATESTPGGFTQLFKGSVPSARATPVPPKPAGELTQMISGGMASKPPSAPSPGAGATRLFSGESGAAPAMAPLPPGPSEYTRVVSPRQLRELQQATPAASSPAPSAATGQAPAMPGAPQMPAWPIPGSAPAPQLASPPMPQGVPSWQSPQVQVQPAAPLAWQPPQAPALIPPAAAPTPAPKAESKILTYLPLIIGLNVLFLIAVLLILLFALKR